MNHKLQVFKDEPGFIKLFGLFKEKYRSLGRIGGTVSIKDFTVEELESVAGFLGWPMEKLTQKGVISLTAFENELANTSFSEYRLLPLLEEMLGETIISKKEEGQKEQEEEENFLYSLKKEIPEADFWLNWIAEKPTDSRWIWSQYRRDPEQLREVIITVSYAFTALPGRGEFERLPFFSQRVTGNPHFFDANEVAARLLHHMMYVDQIRQGVDLSGLPRTVGELNDLLAEYGILRDDLWNFVTCQQLLAGVDGTDHPVWKAASETATVMNIPMKELMKVNRVWPRTGNQVWVVENSSVSSSLMDALPNAPIVCTHGQLRMASWRLLDLLVASGSQLYYSGDIDPEGILIANRLKQKYAEHVLFWRMDVESYQASLSDEDITTRLSKLDSITTLDWHPVINEMNKRKKAGYQEALISGMIEDISRHF